MFSSSSQPMLYVYKNALNRSISSMGFSKPHHWSRSHLSYLPTAAITLIIITSHLCWTCHIWQGQCLQMCENWSRQPSRHLVIFSLSGRHYVCALWWTTQILQSVEMTCAEQLSAKNKMVLLCVLMEISNMLKNSKIPWKKGCHPLFLFVYYFTFLKHSGCDDLLTQSATLEWYETVLSIDEHSSQGCHLPHLSHHSTIIHDWLMCDIS